jgi:hypothetical protein
VNKMIAAAFQKYAEEASKYLGGTEWIVACIISLFISASVVGLIYLLAALFQSERLKERGKSEFSEFILSLIIFGVITFSLAILNVVSISISPAKVNYVESAKNFFYDKNHNTGIFYLSFRSAYSLISQVTILTLISTSSVDLLKFSSKSLDGWIKLLSFLGPIGVKISAALVGLKLILEASSVFVDFSFSPFMPLNILVDPLEDLFAISILNSYIAYGQYTLIDFLYYISLATLLPLGLFLRAFPLTRKTGSTLISISLIGLFFYPLSINLTGVVYNEVAKNYDISLPVFFPEDSGRNIVLHSPEQFSNIKEGPITWYINSPNAVWRIWKKVDCNKFSASKVWSCSCNISKVSPGRIAYEMDAFGNLHPKVVDSKELISKLKCNCNGIDTENELPPQPSDYDGYKLDIQTPPEFEVVTSVGTVTTPSLPAVQAPFCYVFVTNGTGEWAEFYPLNHLNKNGTYTFLIDAYDFDGKKYIPIGRDEATFIVGDVCKGLRYVECIGREISKGAKDLMTVGIWSLESTWEGLKDLLKEIGIEETAIIIAGGALPPTIGGLPVGGVLLPYATAHSPYIAGKAYIGFGKKLVPVLLPVFANVLSIVISLIISITGFRSVSVTIGGESRILGLAKLV